MNKKRMKAIIVFILCVYFFIVAIELIKSASLSLSGGFIQQLFSFVSVPAKAFAVGWLAAAILQSGSLVGAITAIMAGSGLFSFSSAIFIILGSRIGATGTELIVPLFIKAKNKKDFRHAFEIGVVNNIYNIFNCVILFFVEYFTGMFTKFGIFLSSGIGKAAFIHSIPNIVSYLTGWTKSLIAHIDSRIVVFILGLAIFGLTLKYFALIMLDMFGGYKKAYKKIHNYFKSGEESFFIGFFITLLVSSTNITISLLSPLAAARLISVYEAIPYILGANISTILGIIPPILVTGNPVALSIILIYLLFTILGAVIWYPYRVILFNATKEITKHLLNVSKATIIVYFLFFCLIPILLLF